jgi:DNA-binding NtrC family response regulator
MDPILVIQDDSSALEVVRQTLDDYEILEAVTAEEALRKFLARNRQSSLLITNVILRKSSGIHVALLLRSELPELPVILVSGHPIASWSHEEWTAFARLQPNSVIILQHPLERDALQNAVVRLIGVRREKTRLAGC